MISDWERCQQDEHLNHLIPLIIELNGLCHPITRANYIVKLYKPAILASQPIYAVWLYSPAILYSHTV